MKKLKYYLLLVVVVILLFLGVVILEAFFKYVGLVGNLRFMARFWVVTVTAFIYANQTTKKYKKQLLRVKLILLANTIFVTTLYGFILLYLDKLGYKVIPIKSIHQLAQGLVLMFIIFNINEYIIYKLGQKMKHSSSNGKKLDNKH